jgi:hypothetical protein
MKKWKECIFVCVRVKSEHAETKVMEIGLNFGRTKSSGKRPFAVCMSEGCPSKLHIVSKMQLMLLGRYVERKR